MKKVYVAGKIGQLSREVITEKFTRAKRELTSMGYHVVLPTELPHDHEKTWGHYMVEDLAALNECDAICLLPCWEDSPGAKIEHAFAVGAGKQVLMYNQLELF